MKTKDRVRSLSSGSSQEQDSPSPSDTYHQDRMEEEDSGCEECSLEEIEKMESMDAWSKTLVAIRVLTEFKKRRKKTLEAEKAKKERRKNLWRRMRLKLRIFNLFANKISSDDPAVDRMLKLKRKLGNIISHHLLQIQVLFVRKENRLLKKLSQLDYNIN